MYAPGAAAALRARCVQLFALRPGGRTAYIVSCMRYYNKYIYIYIYGVVYGIRYSI